MLTQQDRQMIDKLVPIAESMGRKYGDDAISVARCTLINKVTKGFDHPNPEAYLVSCMKFSIKNYLSRMSIVRVPRAEYGKAEIISVPLDGVVRATFAKPSDLLFKELKELLSERDFFIIESRMLGMTYEEIGEGLGRNKQYAQREHIKIQKKVRRLIS